MKFANKTFSLIITLIILTIVSCSKEDPFPERIIVNSAVVEPNIGGPNEPNQVFFNLSTNMEESVQRDSWDLRFYCNDEFRVSLNTSIYMATKQLDTNDMNNVNTTNVQSYFNTVAVGTFDPNNVEFVDDFDGQISNTAIAEVNDIDSENMVYLVNLGYEVPNSTPQTGSAEVACNSRGWKKIRILKNENNYVLQYANLDETSFEELIIEKDTDYNFVHFSFNSEQIISVEPKKNEWDFCFTVFTNEIVGFGSYGFTDFIITNNLQNVGTYIIDEDTDINYEDFSLSNVDESLFDYTQRSIGNSWRLGGGPSALPTVKSNLYYILKDTDGVLYKVKFTRLTSTTGERGFPEFRYDRL